MARYIDAEKLNLYDNLFMSKDTINHSGVYVRYRAVEKLIKNAPTADVEEVRHGKWLLEREPNGKPYCFHCSVCDSDFGRISIKSATPFCPWCGAKMDWGEE